MEQREVTLVVVVFPRKQNIDIRDDHPVFKPESQTQTAKGLGWENFAMRKLRRTAPLVLKDTTPTNISNLTPEQRKDFFLISSETSQDQVELKKTHKYYSQIQFQMYITGYKKSKFIV